MIDWERVVREDGAAGWRTACRLLGNRQDAQECLQDAFADAVSISRTQHVQNWRALLQKLVTARAMDCLRRRYRRRPLHQPADFAAAADPAPLPPQQAENAELLQKLRESLPALPPQQAQAFLLHCVEGWSYQEIADRFSISVGAVGMLLLRARARLKELLGGGVGSGRR